MKHSLLAPRPAALPLVIAIVSLAAPASRLCASPDQGRETFKSLRAAVAEAAKKVEPSLALVKIQASGGGESPQTPGVVTINRGGGTAVGVFLTPEGHLLVPGQIKPDSDDRIEVSIGEQEYQARALKADAQLDMTILKIEADRKFQPVKWAKSAVLGTGEYAVMVTPTQEESNFKPLIDLAMCRGEEAGRYRRFALDRMPSGGRGVPVLNLDGEIVGLATRMGVLAALDIKDDVAKLLAEATGVRSPGEEAKRKGWAGVAVEPIAKPYAQANNLSVSAMWVRHVSAGSPMEKAGVKIGDLVVEVNGRALQFTGGRAREFFQQTLHPTIDSPFEIVVLRDGKKVKLSGVFTKEPELDELRAQDLGVAVKDFRDSEAFARNFFAKQGVLVTEVVKGSPAATSSSFGQGLLSPGDIIVEVAGRPVANVKEFSQVLDGVRQEKPSELLVKYFRGRTLGFAGLNLKIGEQSNESKP